MTQDELIAGARTVVNIAEHFERLKDAATEMIADFGASDRGFFTPEEDERARHLLVSYWQSRNALIELVIALREEQETAGELRPTAFLVAFSGALVLIDAARFLREQFHDRPIPRGKLNEPEPHFGIPEGTYDRIQNSLTSPVHAWHLYHAARYYEDHTEALRATASSHSALQPLPDLIDRLRSRIDVTMQTYATARLKARATELATTVRRDLLARSLYGLQKAVSRLVSEYYVKPDHEPRLPDAIRTGIAQLLRPGDVLVTRKEHALTNYFLPGFWPHAALYVGRKDDFERLGIHGHENVSPRWERLLACDDDEPGRVLEALKDGVWVRSLTCPLSSDAVTVLRPSIDEPLIARGIARGFFHDGKPYDFDFDFTRSDRLVCTEVVYRAYQGLGGMEFQLTSRAGRMTLAAEDLMRMALAGDSFQVLATFSPGHSDQLLAGADAEQLVRDTIAAA